MRHRHQAGFIELGSVGVILFILYLILIDALLDRPGYAWGELSGYAKTLIVLGGLVPLGIGWWLYSPGGQFPNVDLRERPKGNEESGDEKRG